VQNLGDRVQVVLEGCVEEINSFMAALPQELPRLARIERCELVQEIPIFQALGQFYVEESRDSDSREIVFPADVAVCASCRREVLDPADRRYRYAFTTCTECGPRYTVINDTPYDRERTTLHAFPLCQDCQREYRDPLGRRFHAESIACPVCGPVLELRDAKGERLSKDALSEARLRLYQGSILALRGVGGFLLAVDAFSASGISLLRRRKERPAKPFAVMMRNLDTVKRYCLVSPEQEELLGSEASPIVILDRKQSTESVDLPQLLLSPDTKTLGVMLPGSPLQVLLFEPTGNDDCPPFEVLVMTSGNKRGEPIAISNEEALGRLSGIADFFLLHNRGINLRADDSIAVLCDGRKQLWRRARGYAPDAVRLKAPLSRSVLALGAELKNTIALGIESQVFLSSHIGDLVTLEALSSFERLAQSLPRFLRKAPECIAVDMHPDLYASKSGARLAKSCDLPLVPVQHHHAHAVSCMAEVGLEESLALVFDGTGYGPDGTIWGGELLHVRAENFKRLAAFRPVVLPGGDAAVLDPARQFVARCVAAGISLPMWFGDYYGLTEEELGVWAIQATSGLNAPACSAAGRLFDSYAACLGVAPRRISYDAEAAVRLESLARGVSEKKPPSSCDFELLESDGILWVDWSLLFSRSVRTKQFSDAEKAALANDFHHKVAAAALAMVEYGLSASACREIVLSGGVFMNQLLVSLLVPALRARGVRVSFHENMPPNDGGISLGQAVIAGRSF
jgi:hydrogenase maturation protein HypF